MVKSHSSLYKGFTLVEVMIVIAIIGVLVAIAYPNYRASSIKAKRGDMMGELQNIAARIQSQKLLVGSYDNVQLSSIYAGTTTLGAASYPYSGSPLYNLSIWDTHTGTPVQVTNTTLGTANWEIRAIPVATGQVSGDGTLTLNEKGVKCRLVSISGSSSITSKCGTSDEWNKN